MKIKIKKVYYCEFCGKHSLKPLNKHEKHCTMNPNRECHLCENYAHINLPKIIEKYKNSYELKEEDVGMEGFKSVKIVWKNEKITIDEIMNDVENCPVCALTVIRCAGLNKFPIDLYFDYQKELKKWWDAKNEYELERDFSDSQ